MTGSHHPIYLVRHGETEWNLVDRYQGRFDSPLTTRGRAQARAIAELLVAELGGSRGIILQSSPLGRAIDTAAVIGERLGLRLMIDARLREISFGSWDGMRRAEIRERFPSQLDGATRYDWYFRAPDGESFDAAAARLGDWLGSCDAPTIAITHGLASRLLRGLYAGIEREKVLALPVPQDGLFRLSGGVIDRLP